MRRYYLLVLFVFALACTVEAQTKVKLWSENPPTNNEITDTEEMSGNMWITKVSVPELEIYLPEKSKATGKAVVICPGGGYAGVSYNSEGLMVAKWLNTQGIAGFVLKYRMPNKHKEIPLDDAQQAIRYVRNNAAKFGIDASKVGICGFSAGGHLASTASTHFTSETRPDFSILFYPVITMTVATHGGSCKNLLGDNPSSVEINMYSNERQVNVNTPPAILLLSADDKTVPTENSTMYYDALIRNGVPATMYIFPSGGHGWGFNSGFKYHKQMTELLADWLDSIGD